MHTSIIKGKNITLVTLVIKCQHSRHLVGKVALEQPHGIEPCIVYHGEIKSLRHYPKCNQLSLYYRLCSNLTISMQQHGPENLNYCLLFQH